MEIQYFISILREKENNNTCRIQIWRWWFLW